MMQLGKVSENGQGLMGYYWEYGGNNTDWYEKDDRTSGPGSKDTNSFHVRLNYALVFVKGCHEY